MLNRRAGMNQSHRSMISLPLQGQSSKLGSPLGFNMSSRRAPIINKPQLLQGEVTTADMLVTGGREGEC